MCRTNVIKRLRDIEIPNDQFHAVAAQGRILLLKLCVVRLSGAVIMSTVRRVVVYNCKFASFHAYFQNCDPRRILLETEN